MAQKLPDVEVMNGVTSGGNDWIVVVDQDEELAATLATLFLQRRLRAYPTGWGVDALLLAHRHRLGLAVVDVRLRDSDGCDLVRRLKNLNSGLPVIMTSADPDPATELRARQLGIVQYVQKPLDVLRLGTFAVTLLAPKPRPTRGSRAGGKGGERGSPGVAHPSPGATRYFLPAS